MGNYILNSRGHVWQAADLRGADRMNIEAGKRYWNGRGDLIEIRLVKGWMGKGRFVDQHGALYHSNGQQWDHVPESTANLVYEDSSSCEEGP